MRRFDKKQNIQKANLLSEQRYLESKELIKEEVDWTDPANGNTYTNDQVQSWINNYKEGKIKKKDRVNYDGFFKRVGIEIPKIDKKQSEWTTTRKPEIIKALESIDASSEWKKGVLQIFKYGFSAQKEYRRSGQKGSEKLTRKYEYPTEKLFEKIIQMDKGGENFIQFMKNMGENVRTQNRTDGNGKITDELIPVFSFSDYFYNY